MFRIPWFLLIFIDLLEWCRERHSGERARPSVHVWAGTATGRKGSMWAAVPAAAACDAVGDDDDSVPLGPGQMPPRNTMLPPLHAEINISIIMVKGQLELEVKFISA